MSHRLLAAAPLALCVACSGPAATKPALVLRTVQFQGAAIPYALYQPSALGRGNALPTLLLFHGAGGSGPAFIGSWQSLAEERGIVLVAPTLSLTAAQETQVTELLPAILDDATAGLAVDPKRTYAFGYSAGGYFSFDAATLLSGRFAGAGVFAAFIAPDYVWIVDKATRATPIALYIGDRDQYFSLDQTRGTRDLLLSRGFPVHYVELPGQDHAYARVSEAVNRDAWEFLSAAALP